MLVVSDTSPFNLLIQSEQESVLPALFGSILVPAQVASEMTHPAAPQVVRRFIHSPPGWLTVIAPKRLLELPRLDLGERAAISLAVKLHADLLLAYELEGRRAARQVGLSVVGAVGILEAAADRGLIKDLGAVHSAIRQTRFHVSDALLNQSLARHLSHRNAD